MHGLPRPGFQNPENFLGLKRLRFLMSQNSLDMLGMNLGTKKVWSTSHSFDLVFAVDDPPSYSEKQVFLLMYYAAEN
jgi:hypothetical protein